MNPLVHDVIKILYTEEGYLPYYPYHLLSDKEMIQAFIENESCFFDDWYPLPDESMEDEYIELRSALHACCEKYLSDGTEIPDWVYSYMLGKVIGPMSGQKDVHDLLVLLNMDNLYDEFTPAIYKSIYEERKKSLGSSRYRSKESGAGYRPPSMFGEPHVIKYLRIEQVSVK